MNARAHAIGVALLALVGAASRAEAAPNEFYAGKTISIITSGGGACEAYGRVFARHMPKFIPGHPTMIVQAMPGAGGARAASFLYKAAPRDGTVIGATSRSVAFENILGNRAAQYDASKFTWIGSGTPFWVTISTPRSISWSR